MCAKQVFGRRSRSEIGSTQRPRSPPPARTGTTCTKSVDTKSCRADESETTCSRTGYLLVGRDARIVHMLDGTHLLRDLEPEVEQLLERHLATSKEWFPHEHVPYGRGRDPVPGEVWTEADADLAGAQLTPEIRSALLVNLLTEDNLPYYFRSVERMFGRDG